jgi:hypothetical protein
MLLPRVLRRSLASVLICALSMLGGSAAADTGADDPTERARASYDRGAEAYERGDFARAAADLAQADELVPNRVTLELALECALLADDGPLAMELAGRVEARGWDGRAERQADQARERYASTTGRVVVRCSPDRACSASAGGAPLPINVPKYFTTGELELELDADGQLERRSVRVLPGGLHTVDAPAPTRIAPQPAGPGAPQLPSVPDAAPASRRGLPPPWFWTGVGVSTLLGAGTIVSALDTRDKHQQFEAGELGASEGRASQNRTNALAALTTVAVGATIVVFTLTDWSGSGGAKASATLRLQPQAALVMLESSL